MHLPRSTLLALSLACATTAPRLCRADTAPYQDPGQPLAARVDDLLHRLTLDEKISLVHANSKFTTAPIPRLGIPTRWLDDGPHGVREDIGPDTWLPAGRTDDFSTALPSATCLAATWDPSLAVVYGTVIGQEARARGKQIMLGPAINMQRTPLDGRNFEYMGEDPFLTGRTAVGYIQGEQSQGLSSCVKHFACNNQEADRGTINVELDERALREIYLPGFYAAVTEGHAHCVMGAYNQIRGQHCCENDMLLNQILKGEWGFDGLVMSDWDGTHNTDEAARNGLDLEMGTEKPYAQYYLAGAFEDGIKSGKYPMALLDDKVRRNLRVMFLTHTFDHEGPKGSLNTPAHQQTAKEIAEAGMVLLKNDQALLPLNAAHLKTIAVIGENGNRMICHSGGSSELKCMFEITPLEGIIRRAGPGVTVTYAPGYQHTPGKWEPKAARVDPALLVDQAVQAAKNADVVIYVGGLNHDDGIGDAEGTDRTDLSLPYGQDALIAKILAANPHTVVTLLSGGAVEMPWLSQAPAVLQAWYPGMESGAAVADVLFGDTDPSGKLPFTFPKQLADSPAHAPGNPPGTYPGVDGTVHYSEGLLIGYRWFDTKKIEPLFPFGFGLSYTHFTYANLKLAPGDVSADAAGTVNVQCDLTNAGDRDGADVAEVYVHQQHPTLFRPEQELKGFAKTFLKAGETKTVTIPLDARAFAFYDPQQHGWTAEKDDFDIRVGDSSRDLPLHGTWTRATASLLKP